MKSSWLVLCMLLGASAASAHVNDRGMDYRVYKDRYGQSCCDVKDCRPAADFVETVTRVVEGGSVVDPALVQELVTARRRDDPLAPLTERERQVLALMAEGCSNVGIAHRLWVTEGTIEKHVHSILSKLPLPVTFLRPAW